MKDDQTTIHQTRGCLKNHYYISGCDRPRKSLLLRKNSGSLFSASYAHFNLGNSNDKILQLKFAHYGVIIEGEKLTKLHIAIAEHRLAYLREVLDGEAVEADEPIVGEIRLLLGDKK